jgi:hypothetical protein
MTSVPLTNTHIHTNYSFSVFESPAEAVTQAVDEGISVLGINDHYTVAGHGEFAEACRAQRVCPMFSMEAVALDVESREQGLRLNDPGNPGRCYLTAKSITRPLARDGAGAALLKRMRAALTERNRQLVDNLNRHLAAAGLPLQINMHSVEALTPAGNTTERHVVQVLAETLLSLGTGGCVTAVRSLCGDEPPSVEDPATLQNFLRSALIKAGCPDYAPESPDAFASIAELRAMYLEMGAVPLYPVLGNPVTEGEEDVDALIAWLAERSLLALEVIPNRNTPERLMAIITAAEKARVPVVTGTEHNTKTPGPLLDEYSPDEPYRTVFFEGALVMLGHRAAIERGESGYVDAEGVLRFSDRDHGLAYFKELGLEFFKRGVVT